MGRYLYFYWSWLCVFGISFCGSIAYANTAPVFTGGHTQTLSVCPSLNPHFINSLLIVTDPDVGQTETWTLIYGAFHGTVTTSYTAVSTGSALTPIGLSYTTTSLTYSGTDTFKFKVSDGFATDTTTVYVTILPMPHVGNITGSASLCTGATITLIDTPSGGVWSSDNAKAIVAIGGIVTGVAAGLDTIRYTVSNTCGSIQSLQYLTIHTSSNPGHITGFDSLCAGTTITLADTVTTGTWHSSNTCATIAAGIVNGVFGGIDTILYTVTNAFCTTSAVHPITINPAPYAGVISGFPKVCLYGFGTLVDTVFGGVWSCTNGNATVTTAGVIYGVSLGIDTVHYIFTNSCGTAIATQVITVNPVVEIQPIIAPTSICIGIPNAFSDSTAGGIWLLSNTHAVIADNMITGVSAGIDTIRYLFNNGCGLMTDSLPINVVSFPYTSNIMGTATLCVGIIDTFTDTLTGGTWRTTNGRATADATGLVTANVAGVDTLIYNVTNACGADSAMTIVTINNQPNAGIIFGVFIMCPKDTIYILDTTMGGVWSNLYPLVAEINSVTYDSVMIIGVSAGMDTFLYSVTNSCGTDIATVPLKVGGTLICPNSVPQIVGKNTGLEIYPNPNNGNFTISLNLAAGMQQNTHFIITNIVGEKIAEFDKDSNIAFNIKINPVEGIYFISASNESGRWSSKIMVNGNW